MSSTNPALGDVPTPPAEDKKSAGSSKINPALAPIEGPVPGGGFVATGLVMPNVQTADSLSSYAEYNVPLSPFIDLDEERARRQTRTEKWANGAAKMLTTAGAAAADGTIGVLYGLGSVLNGGSYYDNEFGRGVDEFNEWMQKELPNYYTEQEQSAEGWRSMGYANFWADKALNGVGYMAGNVLSTMALTGAINVGSKALKAYQLSKAVKTGTAASKLFGVSARIGTKALNAGKVAGIGMLSAASEAGVEARSVLREAESRLMSQRAKELGVRESELSASEIAEVKENAASEANMAFWLNMAVVGTSNVITFGNLILPRYLQARPGLSGISRAAKGQAWVDATANIPKYAQTAKILGKELGTGFVSEGLQELSQTAIADNSEGIRQAWDDSDGIWGTSVSMIETLGKSLVEAYGTKEGFDSMLVGGIIGMLGGGSGAVRRVLNQKAESEERSRLIQMLNNPRLFNAVDRAEANTESNIIASQMHAALERGDHKTYRDRQMDLLINEAIQFENAGRMDFFLERLEDELEKSDEEFRESWGIPETIRFDKVKLISGIKEDLRKFQDIKQTIDARYPPTEEYNFAQKKYFGEEEAQKRLLQIKAERDYKNALYTTAFKLEDIDTRIQKLGMKLNEISGTTISDSELKVPLDTTSPTKLDEKKLEKLISSLEDARVKALENNPQRAVEYHEAQADLLSLLADRNQAVVALNNLEAPAEKREQYLKYLQEQEDEKARKQRDVSARDTISNAKNSKDIEDFVSGLTEENMVSEDVRQEAADKLREFRSQELLYEQETEYKSVDDLEADLIAEEDEFKKDILRDVIRIRKAAGKLDPLKVRESKTAEKKGFKSDTTSPKKPADRPDAGAEAGSTKSMDELLGRREAEKEIDYTPEAGKTLDELFEEQQKVKDLLEEAPVVDKLLSLQKDRGIELSVDGTEYVQRDKSGKIVRRFQRVSSLKTFKRESVFPGMEKAAARGTIIDDMLRHSVVSYNAANGKFPSRESLASIYREHELVDETETFSKEFLDDIYNTFKGFVEDQRDRGYSLITDFPPVFGTINGKDVAGTVDLIAYNKTTGDVKVIDLKTGGSSRRSNYKATVLENGKRIPKYTYEIDDAIQLSSYTELIYQMVGLSPSTPYIFPVVVRKSQGEYIKAMPEILKSSNGKKRYTLSNTKLVEAREMLDIKTKEPTRELESEAAEVERQLRSEDDYEGAFEKQARAEEEEFAKQIKEELEAEKDFTEKGRTRFDKPKSEPQSNKTVAERASERTGRSSTVANGELKTTIVGGKYQVEVDSNGDISRGNDLNQRHPDGTPLNINREIVKTTPANVLKAAPLTLELVPTQWQKEKEDSTGLPVSDREVPVGVFITLEGENGPQKHLIGVLKAASIQDPKEFILEREGIAKKLRGGEPVNGNITNVHAGNIINTYDKSGKKAFFSVNEAKGDAFMVLTTKSTRGILYEPKEMDAFVKGGVIPQEAEDALAGLTTDAAMGRVLALVERPGHPDKYGVLPAYTATMDEKSVAAVARILSRSDNVREIADDVLEVVGLPLDPKINSIFYVTNHENIGDAAIYFRHKNGKIIRMSNDEFAKFYKGEKYKFSVGEFDYKRLDNRPEGYERIVSVKGTDTTLAVGIKGYASNFQVVWEGGNPNPTVYSKMDAEGNLIPLDSPASPEEVAGIMQQYLPESFMPKIDAWVKASTEGKPNALEDIYEDVGLADGDSVIFDTFGPKVVWRNTQATKYDATDATKEEKARQISVDLQEMKPDLMDSFNSSLLAQRRQVNLDAAFMNLEYESKVTGERYASYRNYLSSPTELAAPQSDKTSILTLDSKSHNGSFYYDVKVEFSTFEPTVSQSGPTTTPTKKETSPEETSMQDTEKRTVGADAGFVKRPKGGSSRRRRGTNSAGENIKNQCK